MKHYAMSFVSVIFVISVVSLFVPILEIMSTGVLVGIIIGNTLIWGIIANWRSNG